MVDVDRASSGFERCNSNGDNFGFYYQSIHKISKKVEEIAESIFDNLYTIISMFAMPNFIRKLLTETNK